MRSGLAIVDDGGGVWGPMTALRPVFDLRTGALTTRERIERVLRRRAEVLIVPESLAELTREANPGVAVNHVPVGIDRVIVAHGRVIDREGIEKSPTLDRAGFEQRLASNSWDAANAIGRPWDIHARLDSVLREDLDAMDLPPWDGREPHVVQQGGHALKVARDARVHPMVVFDTEKGPVVIDQGAIIGSFTIIMGPCYVGPQTLVAPHTQLRLLTTIGPQCVVAGEIAGTVMHGRSNKTHAGYLGNSLVGEWVNLGADTNVSNLKNTYGTVRMQLSAERAAEDTGQLKIGPVIGDFVRTGIGSRLMTGSCIDTGTMLAVSDYGPKYAPPFRFITDAGDEPYDMDRFLATARTMMQRRDRTLSVAIEARLRVLKTRGI